METKLNRKEAIKAIKMYMLLHLNIEEKGNILLGEGLDSVVNEDESWNQGEIFKHKNNKLIVGQFQFGALVTNKYLEALIKDLYKVDIEIIDQQPEIKQVAKCICCGYKVAFENEEIDICPVCYWQYSYIKNEESYSSPNHSSLKDYRENFQSKYEKDTDNLRYKIFSK
ncbi:CPCC family cysteine-rich protein [Hymenobacter sp. H14-R3]|uniref:CPCC family cysteine-rich protein n=1 Tax=Hymenobacter sp. H14-R3 TaxID=3046308 RepID=UPI0024B89BF9|nr:CPCC family cysteine-rich protein [Hymenobacter sp. H14-R3]MDJ0368076.1 CPCC family cysteine-rich protein [Hymenobacter sp. H14-R3]